MKRFALALALSAIFLAAGSGAWATLLTSEYTVSATTADLGGGNYQYSYEVTNNNQGGGAPHGLDGFFIQVPQNATILSINDPPSYNSGGYWEHGFATSLAPIINSNGTLKPGYQWLWWWGQQEPSVYPVGYTASFSFQANAPPGLSQGVVTTYSGAGSYQSFEGNMKSPIPLPPTVLLLGSGLLGLGLLRRKWGLKK
jgi:hypothetical protein